MIKLHLFGQFIWFCGWGAYLPYYPVYLRELGFRYDQIGILFGVFSALRVVAPMIWTAWGLRPHYLGWLGLAALPFVALSIWGVSSYPLLILAQAGMGFLMTPVSPAMEPVNMQIAKDPKRYGFIRSGATLGFLTGNVAGGWLMAIHNSHTTLYFVLGCFAVFTLDAWLNHGNLQGLRWHFRRPTLASIGELLRRPGFGLLMLTGALVNFGSGATQVGLTPYLSEKGIGGDLIGYTFATALVAETLAMFLFPLRRWNWKVGFAWTIPMTSLRWFLLGIGAEAFDSASGLFWLVVVSNVLHGFTFGVLLLATVDFFQTYLPKEQWTTAHAWNSALVFGAANSSGQVFFGYLMERWGFGSSLLVAGSSTLIAIPFFIKLLKKMESPNL